MKKGVALLAVLSFYLFSNSMLTQEKPEYMAKYLISLVRYIQWPKSMNEGNFKIGVYGSFNVYKAVAEHTMGTGLQQRNVDVMNITKTENIASSKLHILIIAEEKCTTETLNKIWREIGTYPTLLVTEKDGASKSSAINFIEVNNKLAFELNKSKATINGIQISSQIENFANKVIK